MNEVYNKTILVALEHLLIIKFRPTFLALTYNQDYDIIEIVMSANQFDYMSVSERIAHVFMEIQRNLPQVLKEHLIVVQPFSGEQMEDVLEDLFGSINDTDA